jgi:hypothetical protein
MKPQFGEGCSEAIEKPKRHWLQVIRNEALTGGTCNKVFQCPKTA